MSDWRDDIYDDEDDRMRRDQNRDRWRDEDRRRQYQAGQGREGYRGYEGSRGRQGYRGEDYGRSGYGASDMDRSYRPGGYGRREFEGRRERGWREDQRWRPDYGRSGYQGYSDRPYGSARQQGGWEDSRRQYGEERLNYEDRRLQEELRDPARPFRDPTIYGETGGGFWDPRPYPETSERQGEERGFLDKASDEVASWFGDEDAERRRRMDRHAGRGPRGYTRSDDRIREDVSDRLTDDAWIDASDIEVGVAGGEVTLSGTVDRRDTKRRAEDIAESVSGVRHVQNNLRLQQQGWSSSGPSQSGRSTSGTAATGGSTSTSRPMGTGATSGTTALPGVGSASSGIGATSRESRETNPTASRS